ncbi:MAG: ATP-dependent zinc metalloprotease FtsH, partial [Candidatus Sericytochromatia bacterium]|nr:ATP-dependent zinc metalloprotease FtsH [Candidatus Sericytochromatia bacterium]
EQAKKHSPCIIFVDEIDAVGRQRGAGLGGGHDEREQTLNQLLVEMDGFEEKHSTIVIAATNRPDILDSALLRPGRFDRQVIVDRPDMTGREQILKVHFKDKPVAADIELAALAKRTPGFTGADLANLANESALIAARHSHKEITRVDIEAAIDRVIAGPEKKSRIITEKEKEIIAYHEMGHTLVGMLLPNCDPVHKVTVVSRGMALGLTINLPEDRVLTSKAQLLDQVAMTMGGRAAEELFFGKENITTGAKNDIERATDMARRMITEFGMSEKLGPMTFGRRQEHVFLGREMGEDRNFSEQVASAIDAEVREIIDQAYEKAKSILEANRAKLVHIARVLMEKETLDNAELRALIDGEIPTQETVSVPT